MTENIDFASFVDPGILPAVEILNKHGFKTFESCQGGEGHCFYEPTIRFEGSEFDLIRAYGVCEMYGIVVHEGKRVFRKTIQYAKHGESEANAILGMGWDNPFNELTFISCEPKFQGVSLEDLNSRLRG